jgi:hypothetical protein
MSNETQLQKAIAIAKKDGFVQISTSEWYVRQGKKQVEHSRLVLLRLYTTDLNYLMPIAVKVRDEINVLVDDAVRNNKYEYLHVFHDLSIAYNKLTIDTNNQYTELFDACYEAVKLLEA